VASLADTETPLPEMRAERRTSVVVIAADPAASTSAGGASWVAQFQRHRSVPKSLPSAPPTTPCEPASGSSADARLRSLHWAALGFSVGGKRALTWMWQLTATLQLGR